MILLVIYLKDIFTPFFISLLFAYILNPIYLKLQNKGLSPNSSIFLIFGVIGILISFCLVLLIPRLFTQIHNSGDLLLGETLIVDHNGNGEFDIGDTYLIDEKSKKVLTLIPGSNKSFYYDQNRNNIFDSEDVKYVFGDPKLIHENIDSYEDTNNNKMWDGNIVNKIYIRGKTFIDDYFKKDEVQRYKIYFKNKLKSLVKDIEKKFASKPSNNGGMAVVETSELDSLMFSLQQGFLYLLWVILMPVYTFFLLKGLEGIKDESKKYLPSRNREHVLHVFSRIDSAISAFFMGRLSASIMISIVCSIFFLLSGVDFAIIFGFLLGFAVMIPIVNIVVVIPPAILVYANNGIGIEFFWIIIAYLSAVTLDMILTPALIGKKANLHIVTVILSFFIFGKLLGIIGVVLAIPFAATTKILFEEYILPRMRDLAEENKTD